MNLLNLTLQKKWYDMIASGEKREEYRQIKPYWITRLYEMEIRARNNYTNYKVPTDFKTFVGILFRNGYRSDARQISFKVDSISIGTGREEWGAEPGKEYFVIKFSPWV